MFVPTSIRCIKQMTALSPVNATRFFMSEIETTQLRILCTELPPPINKEPTTAFPEKARDGAQTGPSVLKLKMRQFGSACGKHFRVCQWLGKDERDGALSQSIISKREKKGTGRPSRGGSTQSDIWNSSTP